MSHMDLQQNMSQADRIIRGVLGIWLLAMSLGALTDKRGTVAAITGIAGAGLLSNSLTGHCGGNALLGINTAENSSEAAQ